MKWQKLLVWMVQVVIAITLLQTLFFKFTAADESVKIFTMLGVEPWGRIGTGVFELIAGIALLVPATAVYGALLAAGLMLGAIFSHITVLGVTGEFGGLFLLSLVVFVLSLIVLVVRRNELPNFLRFW